jgi:hypothetical protein
MVWGERWDLNPRPSVPQTDALPAELRSPPLRTSMFMGYFEVSVSRTFKRYANGYAKVSWYTQSVRVAVIRVPICVCEHCVSAFCASPREPSAT